MDINYYLTYDLPVPYRNIKIYPVTMRDYFEFGGYSQCFTIDKDIIPDISIISMSNLEYLYHATAEDAENKPYVFWFDRMLSLCLKEDNSFSDMAKSILRYKYDEKGKPIFFIRNEKYTSKDFEIIKDIISQQNLLELPDKNISKEVRDALEEAKEYKRKASGEKQGTLEDYILSVSLVTGWTLDYIYSMTIRKFTKSVLRYDNLIHYKIYLAASMSGMVEFKDKSFIKHWLTNLDEKDKYKDVSVDLEAIQDTISLESAKK